MNLMEDWKAVWGNKLYRWMLGLTAVCSYGFFVTHQTVGIDDTPYAYYFEEGLNVIVGRWLLFLCNKVFRISDFSPFLTDLAGVLIFMGGVTVWCALLHSICKDRIPMWGYTFFSCIFLSSPLIAEVYPYYLHNGISVGYLCTGVSLCFFRKLTEQKGTWKEAAATGVGTSLFLAAALGCYESFMIVWLLGVFLVLLTKHYMEIRTKVIASLAKGALAAVAAMILRSVIIALLISMFGLGHMRGEAVARSVSQMAGWLFQPGAWAEMAMAIKRVYVMYGVFALAYLPVRIFVIAVGVVLLCGLYDTIRRKNVCILLLTFGGLLTPFLLVAVEGKATLYRAAQFLPVVCGYGAFLASYAVVRLGQGKSGGIFSEKEAGGRGRALWDKFTKVLRRGLIFALCVALWNQCFDMNQWFYVDWMKYQSAVDLAGQIAYELEGRYDISKPIVFTGAYQAPRGIIEDAYVGYQTDTFYQMKRLTDSLDEHLLDKFYREYGVWVAQTPALSVVDWGINAFGSDEELIRFFAMHGYEFVANTDAERFETALQISIDWPEFPKAGSVKDMGEYIIVHF